MNGHGACKIWQHISPEEVEATSSSNNQLGNKRRLEKLRNPKCTACPLHKSTTNVCIMGRGDRTAPLMLIGEAPGEAEAETGQPFMGRSGQLLNSILEEVDVKHLAYITNTCRCRPPENRTPEPFERNKCSDLYLWREIAIVDPVVIVLLGKTALWAFDPIPQPAPHQSYLVDISQAQYVVIPTWHPAYCLRSGLNTTNQLRSSIKLAKRILHHAKRLPTRPN